MQARAAAFGAGLVALGCKPQPAGVDYENLNGPHTILLWEDTCADWLTALIGAGGQSIAVATSYATLGISAVAEALNNSACPVIVCNFHKIADCAALKKQCRALTTVIYTTNLTSAAELAKGVPACPGLKVLSVDEACKLGGPEKPYSPPAPSTISVIMCGARAARRAPRQPLAAARARASPCVTMWMPPAAAAALAGTRAARRASPRASRSSTRALSRRSRASARG